MTNARMYVTIGAIVAALFWDIRRGRAAKPPKDPGPKEAPDREPIQLPDDVFTGKDLIDPYTCKTYAEDTTTTFVVEAIDDNQGLIGDSAQGANPFVWYDGLGYCVPGQGFVDEEPR